MPSPTETCHTTDPQALAQRVRDAIARGVPLVDYGVAHRGLGHAPPQSHEPLSLPVTPGSHGIIEHYTRDLAVRLAAGATVGDIAAALHAANQFLPLDADSDLTVGEVILHEVYGPLRAGYGSVRDLLLGLRYIDGVGRDIHVGGRTVKNVAGYDVTRLMVGSLGELGIVYEATLRTYAVPEEARTVEVTLDEPDTLSRHITDLLLTDATPAGLSIHREGNRWLARFRYFNTPDGCAAQQAVLVQHMERLAGSHAKVSNVLTGTLAEDEARRTAERRWRRLASVLVKLVTPPAATGAACEALRDSGWRIDALPVHGCIFIGGEGDAEHALALDQQLARIIEEHRGFRVWYNRPDNDARIAPFAPLPSEYPLLCRLKTTMDPHNVFNPGRFLRGNATPDELNRP